MSEDAPEEPVKKLPRKVGFKLGGPQLLRIALTGSLLALIILMRKPCSDSVSKFVTDFGSGSATNEMPKPGNIDKPIEGEIINGEMTPEQFKAAVDRAHARAMGSAGSGSVGSAGGSGGGAGTGPGPGAPSGGSAGSAFSGSSSGSSGRAGSGSSP